ncbi:MAG: undecaprenyl-diphosphate phosphatase [Candidatus Magasanikbacteria bacterium]
MIEKITLAATQGILEWLPVSSEGFLVLIKANFFNGGNISSIVDYALFLHFGTFLAALVYFRAEVWKLIVAGFNYFDAEQKKRKVFDFLLISTIVSGLLGLLLLEGLRFVENSFNFGGSVITAGVGVLLLFTGFMQLKAGSVEKRIEVDISYWDGVLLGIVQGLAVLPGISRSGFTVSALLLKDFKEEVSLRLSFLMSLPIVFFGNLVMNSSKIFFSFKSLAVIFISFIFGLITIDLLLKTARKMNFGWFVILFGLLTIGATFI